MNYHFETSIISRRKGRSVTGSVSYITGQKLYDCNKNKMYNNPRRDVVWKNIFVPGNAPPGFRDYQQICNEIDRVEIRWDARTARQFIGSLPNELSPREQIQIVKDFVERNFVSSGLCAIAAIHRGHNADDPTKNNPHVHLIVPTRIVGPDGFNKKKDREHDKKLYIGIWREQWAQVQNLAYERRKLDIRVSHESLEVQGKRDREPTIHLSRIDWQKEQRGERTATGDRKRAIKDRNRMRQLELEQELNLELFR